jgi:hypothetical protein
MSNPAFLVLVEREQGFGDCEKQTEAILTSVVSL